MNRQPAKWYYLPTLADQAVTQMAIDSALLEICERSPDTGFLRFYRMTPPAVTIGRNQRWRRVVDPDACRARCWTWARRPTGGGALLHAEELNYAVVLGRSVLAREGRSDFRAIFEWIMEGFAGGFSGLGLHPTIHSGRSTSAPVGRAEQHGLCGRSLTRFEIANGEGKLLAAAQMLKRGAVLQHGTVYLRAPKQDDRFWPVDLAASDVTGVPATGASFVRSSETPAQFQRWANLGSTGRALGWDKLAEVLHDAFAESLQVSLHEAPVSSDIWSLARELVEDWRSSGWQFRR